MDDYYDTDVDYTDQEMYLFECLNITEDELDYVNPADLDYSNCSYIGEGGIWKVKPPGTIGKSIQMKEFTH